MAVDFASPDVMLTS